MDITYFINSRDIAQEFKILMGDLLENEDEIMLDYGEPEYLSRKAEFFEGKKDMPARFAWIIRQSKKASIEAKHEAWQEIIDTMPDCILPKRRGDYEGSLHSFLKEYMSYECNLLNCLKSDDADAVYTYDLKEYHGLSDVYKSFSGCMDAIIDEFGEDDEIIRIEKRWQYPDERSIIAYYSIRLNRIMSVVGTGFGCQKNFGTFDWMWFDFPTPFKRGDILVSPDGVPFVLDRLCTWEVWSRNIKRWRELGDTTDMHCHGYFVADDGRIYYTHHMDNYMDMEYYRGELKGYQRILKAVSNYIRDEISLDVLLNAYHIIRAEETAANDKAYLGIIDEWMERAGLK